MDIETKISLFKYLINITHLYISFIKYIFYLSEDRQEKNLWCTVSQNTPHPYIHTISLGSSISHVKLTHYRSKEENQTFFMCSVTLTGGLFREDV